MYLDGSDYNGSDFIFAILKYVNWHSKKKNVLHAWSTRGTQLWSSIVWHNWLESSFRTMATQFNGPL